MARRLTRIGGDYPAVGIHGRKDKKWTQEWTDNKRQKLAVRTRKTNANISAEKQHTFESVAELDKFRKGKAVKSTPVKLVTIEASMAVKGRSKEEVGRIIKSAEEFTARHLKPDSRETFDRINRGYVKLLTGMVQGSGESKKKVANVLTVATITKTPDTDEREHSIKRMFGENGVRAMLNVMKKGGPGYFKKVAEDPHILVEDAVRSKLTGRPFLNALTKLEKEELVRKMAQHPWVDRMLEEEGKFSYWFGRIGREVKNSRIKQQGL